MARGAPGEIDRLRREVERAMRENHDAEDILPLLARLARAAAPESDAWIYAHRHLAELGVEHDPWRAALFARRVIARRPDDDGAWAVLGLAQSLLGNFRCAARAYEQALALTPDNPWYAHNLGHLYDVALDHPADALTLLGRATLAQPQEADIAASYAHALARCGKVAQARRVLRRAIRRGGTADQMALSRWLDAGAPPHWTPDSRASAKVDEGSTPKPQRGQTTLSSPKPPVDDGGRHRGQPALSSPKPPVDDGGRHRGQPALSSPKPPVDDEGRHRGQPALSSPKPPVDDGGRHRGQPALSSPKPPVSTDAPRTAGKDDESPETPRPKRPRRRRRTGAE